MASGRSASNKDAYYEKNEFGAYVRPLQPKPTRMAVVLYPNSLRSHDRTAASLGARAPDSLGGKNTLDIDCGLVRQE